MVVVIGGGCGGGDWGGGGGVCVYLSGKSHYLAWPKGKSKHDSF